MFQPLSTWLKGSQPLPERFYNEGYIDKPDENWNVWLSIEEVKPLHKVEDLKWISLKEARSLTHNYLVNASEIIMSLEGGWLDKDERMMIKQKLGFPPIPSLPIYLITCMSDKNEKLVYVGKTKNTSRFSNGHAVALKLHNPIYNNMRKKVYRATVWFYFNNEYIALDWIQPESLALELLDSVESQLIFHFKPELNIYKKWKNYAKWQFYIHIQNFTVSSFLNDKFF